MSHRPLLAPVLRGFPQPLGGFTFAGLFGWAEIFAYEWRRLLSGSLLLTCVYPPDPHRHLVQPLGRLSRDEERGLLAAARRLDYPLQIHAVGEPFLKAHPALVEAFVVEEDRGRFDYIYDAQDLALLRGHRFARKRNHLTQAEHAHSWTMEPLSATNLDLCRQIASVARTELADPENPSFIQENRALARTLEHALELEQQGIVLYADGKPAAFSIFEEQAPGLAVIHFERAIRAFKGSFQMVNREAARVLVSRGFVRINREDDLGLPGLRQAKLSYYPQELAKSFRLTLKS